MDRGIIIFKQNNQKTMKKLLMFSALMIGLMFTVTAQKQNLFKVNNYEWKEGYVTKDTVVAVGLTVQPFGVVLGSDISMNFLMTSYNKKGGSINTFEIRYENLRLAAKKNGVPDANIPAFLLSVMQGITFGTTTQKVSILNSLLAAYGIVVKPDKDQDGLFTW
jgi:hypothetical protein